MNLKEKKSNENKKLSKQPEQEQNQRNGHHMEGYQQGRWRGREVGRAGVVGRGRGKRQKTVLEQE